MVPKFKKGLETIRTKRHKKTGLMTQLRNASHPAARPLLLFSFSQPAHRTTSSWREDTRRHAEGLEGLECESMICECNTREEDTAGM